MQEAATPSRSERAKSKKQQPPRQPNKTLFRVHDVLLSELAEAQKLALVRGLLRNTTRSTEKRLLASRHLPDPCQGLPLVTSDRELGGSKPETCTLQVF